jgi:hypothetical protein
MNKFWALPFPKSHGKHTGSGSCAIVPMIPIAIGTKAIGTGAVAAIPYAKKNSTNTQIILIN